MQFVKKHWFKLLISALVLGLVIFLSIPKDNVSRKELLKLEKQLRKEAFDAQQSVIDSLEKTLSKTDKKIVSLQKRFQKAKDNLQNVQEKLKQQQYQYQTLKNEVQKINYSDSSINAILHRISPNN